VSTPTTAVRFEARGKHRELLLCRDTEVAAVGRAGSGKTLAACWKLHLGALQVEGYRALLLRATHLSLTGTTLVTFQKQVAAAGLRDGSVKWFSGSAKDPPAFRYPGTGAEILVAGGDRPEKFLSAELDRVFIDEAVEVTLDLHETLITRLRNTAPTYKQIILGTNPSYPSHWIKQRADEGTLTLINSTHRDNPHYANRDGSYTAAGLAYMAKLDALSGVRRMRLKDGLWRAADGAIYTGWDENVHLIKPFRVPDDWPLYLTVDFGFVHPMVIQWWRMDPDGRLYLTREIYRTRTLVEDHARHVLRIMAQHPKEPRPTRIICDHDAEDRATLDRHLQMATMPANKNVSEGLQAVQSRMKVQPDGKARIYIFRDAPVERDPDLVEAKKPSCTADEVGGYVWDTKPGSTEVLKEQPKKAFDDGCDGMRYMVAEADLGRRPRYRSFNY
jgi:phage terminase large subunit